ncbi:PAS domain-containing protein [Bradyrhizobium sp. INPA01-394B]|uniref:histidine kinase n=1 Tax=Bradyrhizobium campsiandrae TaxID=1729892 RepID=A0ABR7UBP4_9BRAD|nr:PAS domain-containing protein [Bradyrhizobium campsiandrae]MBC9878907.1 PAS domain-containing protein [Bradyrhizobium campsiandrae]MBC9980832.1 PAS domain-containing protein [Bradyrhizobium campsiandrae]
MVDWQTTCARSGKIGAMLSQFDWSATPLGRPADWADSFRDTLGFILKINHPMLIWWGADFVQFYNNAFDRMAEPFLRDVGFGVPAGRLWRGFCEVIDADMRWVMSGKGSVQRDRQFVRTKVDDREVERCWSYTLSPVEDENGICGVLLVCRDDTSDHVATLALKSRDTELARIQYVGKYGSLEVDLTSGFRNERSPEYLAIHGLPPAERYETHENWVRRIHENDRHRTEHTFIKAVQGDSKGYSIQYRIVRPSDGKIRWIFANTQIERDNSGRAMRLIGVHSDITDHVSHQTVEQARLAETLDLLRCAVILTDARGHLIRLNRAAEDLLDRKSAVRVRHNIVRASCSTADRALGAALRLAAEAGASAQSLLVKLSHDEDLPMFAHILPIGGVCSESLPEASAVLAIFIQESDLIRDAVGLLASAYRLSPAEARLLSNILGGRNLPEAATELRVSTDTVKTQLKAIFRKTGVNRQSELIMLASRLSAPVLGERISPGTFMGG